MTYRQLLTDVSLAVLLAAPSLALVRPNAELPASTTIADKPPVAEIAEGRFSAR